MTDQQVQRKLNQLMKVANELIKEAKSRYGPQGQLFFEADGHFHLMDGDSDHRPDRQKHVRFTSAGYCNMDSGAW